VKIDFLIAQFPVSLSIQENLAFMIRMLDQTRPGDWILFPEGSVSGYALDFSFLDSLDPQELNTALDILRIQAQDRDIFLWVGTCTPEGGI